MDSEKDLRKALEEAEKNLAHEKWRGDFDRKNAERAKYAREQKASNNTAQIVFFGGIALIFVLALFGIS